MRALRWFGAALIGAIALASASACQVALRAEDEDPRCSPNGKLCAPGRICRGGLCQQCTPKPEECNFEDDDCDGEIDEDFDQDKDGFTVCGEFGKTDCNDDPAKGGADVHPGAAETCNGVDDNCDGRVDEEPNGCGESKTCLAGKGECVNKGDCRFFGCPMGKGCDVTSGICIDGDCRVTPCKTVGEVCDRDLGRCVPVIAFGDGCDTLAKCAGSPEVACINLVELGISARSKEICTKACCETATCPDGFVCKMGSTSGASVCVRAADISLVTGALASNGKCTKPEECRSGTCTGGSCLDGCCGTIECGSAGTCSIRNPGDNRYFCRAPVGTKVVGNTCSSNSECASGYCVPQAWSSPKCTKHCCGSADCPNLWKCQEFTSGSAVIPMCEPIPFTLSVGTLRGGALCSGNSQCRSNTCEDGYCSDFCCRDSDCVPKSFCRPRASDGRFAMKCTKAAP